MLGSAAMQVRWREIWKLLKARRTGVGLSALNRARYFDAQRYRELNSDLACPPESGAELEALDHYLQHGYWEGRECPVLPDIIGEPTTAPWLRCSDALQSYWSRVRRRLSPCDLADLLNSTEKAHLLRVALPRWAKRSGYFMLELAVDCGAGGLPISIRGLRDGEARGTAAVIHGRPGRYTKRLLRFSTVLDELQIELLSDQDTPSIRSFRLKPVTAAFAKNRIVRRLRHHHGAFAAQTSTEISAHLVERAHLRESSTEETMWAAYDGTFPPTVRHPNYRHWLAAVEAPEWEYLDRNAPSIIGALEYTPLLSILVPTKDTPGWMLQACFQSVLAQSYPHWELCIADDASTESQTVALIEEYALRDSRIRTVFRSSCGHICHASNSALELATGDFVVLLDHDDLLSRHALLLVVRALQSEPMPRVLYSDEDKIDSNARRRDPHFKPRFDPDLLLGLNYIAHLLVADAALIRQLGGFRPGHEGSQDHDLVLRLTETVAPNEIAHIPWVLYHWRISDRSTASAADNKPYTTEAGLASVRDALSRRGLKAIASKAGQANTYRIEWRLPLPAPMVSLIIPTRNGVHLLKKAIGSILEMTRYEPYELLIIDNRSDDSETLAYLDELARDERITVFRYDAPFNYSAINNFAVRQSRGPLLAMVNNDIEVVDGGWLEELASLAVRPEIGCVGPKLLYPEGTIQHAGVVLGMNGVAGHSYKRMPGQSEGYFRRLLVNHGVSAVTGACLMVRRELFDKVGGLDEAALPVAFNDIDFCIKVREAGYRNLVAPNVTLIHHESATRGSDEAPEHRGRFARERQTMRQRWGRLLLDDPYYSPNLSLDHEDYSVGLRR